MAGRPARPAGDEQPDKGILGSLHVAGERQLRLIEVLEGWKRGCGVGRRSTDAN